MNRYATVNIVLHPTDFQRGEIDNRLSVSADEGWAAFGHYEGKSFVVTDLPEALYAITSARDLARDTDNPSGQRSLQKLVDQVLALAGPEAVARLHDDIKEWL